MWEDGKVWLNLTLVLRVLINPRFQNQILEVWVLINNLHIWTKFKIFPVINIQHSSHYAYWTFQFIRYNYIHSLFSYSSDLILFIRYNPIHPIQSCSSYTILFILLFIFHPILSYSSYYSYSIIYYPIHPIIHILSYTILLFIIVLY